MGKVYEIGVVPGDGTGPEVVAEGLKVLEAVAEKTEMKINFTHYDFGGERYLRSGETLPDSAIEAFRQLDALYLGAIGHPDVKPGILEKEILLRLRFSLDQYINLRPVKLYPGVETPLKDKGPEHIDFVVVRENTEGLYTGAGGFLNWAYNSWYGWHSLDLIDPFQVTDAASWPRWTYGDPFVVYPGPDGPLDSIRWELFAESLQDYAILQAAGISRDDPLLAELIDFETFPRGAAWVTGRRAELLRRLS